MRIINTLFNLVIITHQPIHSFPFPPPLPFFIHYYISVYLIPLFYIHKCTTRFLHTYLYTYFTLKNNIPFLSVKSTSCPSHQKWIVCTLFEIGFAIFFHLFLFVHLNISADELVQVQIQFTILWWKEPSTEWTGLMIVSRHDLIGGVQDKTSTVDQWRLGPHSLFLSKKASVAIMLL